MRIPEQIIKKHFDWCGWREHIHGQPLVVDFSYMSNIKNIKHRKSMIKTEAAHAVMVSFKKKFTSLAKKKTNIKVLIWSIYRTN